MSDTSTVYMLLGRAGDILNILPFFWHEAQHGRRHGLCVARDYAHLISGLDYVAPVIWEGPHNQPTAAYNHLRRQGQWLEVIVPQVELNPIDNERKTDSYQRESWRHARQLENFGRWPLVLEESIPWARPSAKPVILFAGDGISSPFGGARAIFDALTATFTEFSVLDLGTMKCEHLYHLIGGYNSAACVVSIDTVHLHLARAARVPFVAIINNGWLGSVPPPAAAATFRYQDATPDAVVGAVAKIVRPESRAVWHAVDDFGEGDRFERAEETWGHLYENHGLQQRLLPFDAPRQVDGKPFLKDLLWHAMAPAQLSDVILWSNSDVGFEWRIVAWARRTAGTFGAASMRRAGHHIGREAFAFTRLWLEQHWAAIPDFILAAPCFDLVLAAMIRKERGIISDLENMYWDFYPCDATERYALHEDHPSSWAADPSAPSYTHNQRLAQEWCKAHMPSLHL